MTPVCSPSRKTGILHCQPLLTKKYTKVFFKLQLPLKTRHRTCYNASILYENSFRVGEWTRLPPGLSWIDIIPFQIAAQQSESYRPTVAYIIQIYETVFL